MNNQNLYISSQDFLNFIKERENDPKYYSFNIKEYIKQRLNKFEILKNLENNYSGFCGFLQNFNKEIDNAIRYGAVLNLRMVDIHKLPIIMLREYNVLVKRFMEDKKNNSKEDKEFVNKMYILSKKLTKYRKLFKKTNADFVKELLPEKYNNSIKYYKYILIKLQFLNYNLLNIVNQIIEEFYKLKLADLKILEIIENYKKILEEFNVFKNLYKIFGFKNNLFINLFKMVNSIIKDNNNYDFYNLLIINEDLEDKIFKINELLFSNWKKEYFADFTITDFDEDLINLEMISCNSNKLIFILFSVNITLKYYKMIF
jgi:hypothetical protein